MDVGIPPKMDLTHHIMPYTNDAVCRPFFKVYLHASIKYNSNSLSTLTNKILIQQLNSTTNYMTDILNDKIHSLKIFYVPLLIHRGN